MTRLVRVLLGLGGCMIAALILFPIFGRSDHIGHRSYCQSNLRQMGLGLMQYLEDYDEKLPYVTQSGGWANAIQPYIKSTQIYQCPDERNGPEAQSNPALTGYTDYFYNSQLQNRTLKDFDNVTKLVSAVEGNDGVENTDAAYAKAGIPQAWRTVNSSPAFRHHDTANYLFLDGHVKAVPVVQIFGNWSADGYYFQPPKTASKR